MCILVLWVAAFILSRPSPLSLPIPLVPPSPPPYLLNFPPQSTPYNFIMLYLKNLWSARLLQALPGAFTRRMFIGDLQLSSGNCKPSPFSSGEFYESALGSRMGFRDLSLRYSSFPSASPINVII